MRSLLILMLIILAGNMTWGAKPIFQPLFPGCKFDAFSGLGGYDGIGIIFAPLATTTGGAIHASAKISGTSGCGNRISDLELPLKNYVQSNLVNLSIDMAKGQGEYLRALLSLFGCPNSEYQEITRLTQMNFGKLFPARKINPEGFMKRLEILIQNDSQSGISCRSV